MLGENDSHTAQLELNWNRAEMASTARGAS